MVVPKNVLFESGAGEMVRWKLLENTNLHNIMRQENMVRGKTSLDIFWIRDEN